MIKRVETAVVVCEESGVVRDALLKLGVDAISVDILPTSSLGPHHQGDALEFLKGKRFDLMVGFPPCTFMTNSSVRWLDEFRHKKGQRPDHRWFRLVEGMKFFNDLKRYDCERIALENPTPHGYAVNGFEIGGKWREGIGPYTCGAYHPYHFGTLEKKATFFWLKKLHPLVATNDRTAEAKEAGYEVTGKVHSLPPSPDRAKLRSKTDPGMADAMADQWSRVTPWDIFLI